MSLSVAAIATFFPTSVEPVNASFSESRIVQDILAALGAGARYDVEYAGRNNVLNETCKFEN